MRINKKYFFIGKKENGVSPLLTDTVKVRGLLKVIEKTTYRSREGKKMTFACRHFFQESSLCHSELSNSQQVVVRFKTFWIT